MEKEREAELLAALVQRPVTFVVGSESLKRRVQLDAFEPELAYVVELRNRAFAFERIDAAESRESLWMVATCLCDELVGHAQVASRKRWVPSQHHVEDVELMT